MAAIILAGVASAPVKHAAAQSPQATTVPPPHLGAGLNRLTVAAPAPAAQRPTLARLVRNPDTSGGLPPYALADQVGTIQRYVEPVPGIDLEPYVDAVVTVRYDTGRTLLASQLDLPALPSGAARIGPPGAPASSVRLAQHVEPLTAEDGRLADEVVPVAPGGSLPPWEVSAPPSGVAPIYLDSMSPGMMGVPSGMPPSMGACPTCGGPCNEFGCGSMLGDAAPGCTSCPQPDPWRFYADVDLYIPRLRVAEVGFGKVSEHYDLAPRVIVGLEDPWLDGRVRYWRYRETTPVLNNGGGSIRFEFDVLDIEATTRLQGRRSDVVLAGGIRLADVDLNINLPRQEFVLGSGIDLIGMTLAADVQTRVFSGRLGQWGVVYGGRLSLLGGDWGGNLQLRDDNFIVHEVYGGVEYLYCFRNFDVHARVTAEWQAWQSDTLAQIGYFETIGFFGPCAQIGIDF